MLRFCTNPRSCPGGKWGDLNSKPPVALPLAAAAPDDTVEGLKMLQLTAFPDATFCAAVGRWSLSIFHHQRQPMKREQTQLIV
jgi:hypothetical protein